jgi:hypothetical protein
LSTQAARGKSSRHGFSAASSSGDTNPSSTNFFAVEFFDGAGSFIFIGKLYDCKTGAFTALNIDGDLLLVHFEAFKEIDNQRFADGPRKTT